VSSKLADLRASGALTDTEFAETPPRLTRYGLDTRSTSP
jgi:hypothetical protein